MLLLQQRDLKLHQGVLGSAAHENAQHAKSVALGPNFKLTTVSKMPISVWFNITFIIGLGLSNLPAANSRGDHTRAWSRLRSWTPMLTPLIDPV
jgi:hypothetical protein